MPNQISQIFSKNSRQKFRLEGGEGAGAQVQDDYGRRIGPIGAEMAAKPTKNDANVWFAQLNKI